MSVTKTDIDSDSDYDPDYSSLWGERGGTICGLYNDDYMKNNILVSFINIIRSFFSMFRRTE